MRGDAVLGLGGTIDFELHWDAGVLEAAAAEAGIASLAEAPPAVIDSERALVLSVLHHLRAGTGGEHFVATADIVEAFAARFGYRTTLGGTPVRAALAMSALGVGSTVHLVSIDDDVRRLLPDDVDYVCSAVEDSTDPHLIVQFPAGARVRLAGEEVVAPAANRLIYPCDLPNARLVLSDRLPDVLAGARVFLISGLNSIQEPAILQERLAQLRDAVRALPRGAVVLYEDAAYHVPAFAAEVHAGLAPVLDVFSLNEDELTTAVGRPVDLRDADDVAAAVRQLAERLRVPALVLHTRFFAAAYGEDAERLRPFLEGGIAVSAARYALGDGATRSEVERLWSTGPRSPIGCALAERLPQLGPFTAVPALDLADVAHPTTIGLGDSFVGGAVAALVGVPV
jgi:ADP-dependent phosphofructokinase/glucokinase